LVAVFVYLYVLFSILRLVALGLLGCLRTLVFSSVATFHSAGVSLLSIPLDLFEALVGNAGCIVYFRQTPRPFEF
jgi:hypothetical protein